MAADIFVTLPVRSLDSSVEFFAKLGFAFDTQFTDDTAACMIMAEDIHIMLVAEEQFDTLTAAKIHDAPQSTRALMPAS